jgi:hypothetical protein
MNKRHAINPSSAGAHMLREFRARDRVGEDLVWAAIEAQGTP